VTQRAETYEKTFAGSEPLIAQHRAAGTGLLPAAAQLRWWVWPGSGRSHRWS
jgi:polyketide synthase PksL